LTFFIFCSVSSFLQFFLFFVASSVPTNFSQVFPFLFSNLYPSTFSQSSSLSTLREEVELDDDDIERVEFLFTVNGFNARLLILFILFLLFTLLFLNNATGTTASFFCCSVSPRVSALAIATATTAKERKRNLIMFVLLILLIEIIFVFKYDFTLCIQVVFCLFNVQI